MRVGQKQKKIDINIPKLDDFIHKVYINVARKVYKNTYLFEINIPPLQTQKHNRELEIIVQECILNTIRESIPVEAILKAYMDETIEEDVIEDKWLSKTIENAQEKIEKNNFDGRKNLLEYDDVMNQHRKVIYSYRYSVLEGADNMHDLVREMITASVEATFASFVKEEIVTEEESENVITFLSGMCQLDSTVFDRNIINTTKAEQFQLDLTNILLEAYQLYRATGDTQHMDEGEKWVMLETIDQAWKQHMLNLDHLKEGIYLRSWGQKNPLIEYKKESFSEFQQMIERITHDIVMRIFKMKPDMVSQAALHEIEKEKARELASLQVGGTQGVSTAQPYQQNPNASSHHPQPVRREAAKIGRNDMCGCGSGKKYKHCCG